MNEQKLLILVDGSSYLYRAFHALPPLTTSRGEPTGAIYGVLNMIRKLLVDYKADYVAVIFDPKGKTHRDSLYAFYKANRAPMADELTVQIEPLHKIIRAMGLPLLIIEGEEADDVIGTLAKEAERKNIRVVISTGDKDMAQLVNEHVTLINTMSNTTLNIQGVIDKFGVKPEQIIDYLALIGDTSDNIPGVVKVGPKTAAKWIAEYGSLEKIIENAQNISGKVGENLREALGYLPLSKELVTIRTDLDLKVHVEDLKQDEKNRNELLEWFTRFEFRSWTNELLEKSPVEVIPADYKIILNENDLINIFEKIKQQKLFAIDIRTNENPVNAQIVGISLSLEPHKSYYIPVGHNYEQAPKQLSIDFVTSQLKSLVNNATAVGHNFKNIISALAKYNINFNNNFFDTMLESYVINSAASRHDINTIALKYLNSRMLTLDAVLEKDERKLPFNKINLNKIVNYCAQYADFALQLHQVLWSIIEKNSGIKNIFGKIETPLVGVLSRMERKGVLVDKNQLDELSIEFGEKIKNLETQAHHLAGKVFNLGSPKQLQEIIYMDLKIPGSKKTPKGQLSTSEDVLEELSLHHPLPRIILEHRGLSKLKSTYTDGLTQKINLETGRVHTSYNQAITSTGRLSSTDPNLQNIPIRNEAGRRIRQTFIARKGYKIVSADYSQIELRIMAHLSQDTNLLHAFKISSDIHTATAAEILNIEPKDVTAEQRRNAKVINFGLIYGMSIFGLSSALGVEREVAEKYMHLYFDRYPKVKEYMENMRNLAHKQGFVETIFGRRLYLPEINVSNLTRRRAAERAAINAPMQGSAADMIKLAMIEIDRWQNETNLDVNMIMQVHDELVFEIAEKDLEQALPQIKQAMCNVVKLDVPILVEIGIGNNWDEAH